MKYIFYFSLKITITSILLLYLFFFSGMVTVQAVIGTLKQTRLPIFFLVICIYLSTIFIATKRWSLFLPEEINYKKLVSLNFISFFFNTFLPGRLGGEIIKAFYVYREIGTGVISVASVFMDKYLGFTAILGTSLIALVFGYSNFKGTELAMLIPSVCVIFLIGNIIFWKVNWGMIKGMKTFYTSLMEYKKNKKALYLGMIISFILQVISITEVYILSIALGIDVPIIYFFIFVPIINALVAIPVTIAGLGLREISFVALFDMFFLKLGVTSHQAVSLSLLAFSVLMSVSLVGGIEYIRFGRPSKKTEIIE